MKKRIVKYMAAALAAAAFFLAASAQTRTDGRSTEIDGVVRFDKTVHDFGDVTTGQGPLTCTFTVTNISSKPAVIYNVVSSCGCTGVKWTREPILPGKSGTITATYSNDEGPYPFDKTLTAYMSDVKKPVVLRLRGTVHDKKLPLSELYPERRGALALKKTDIKLGNLSQNGQKSDAATVANVGSAPIKVSFSNVSPGLSVSVSPNPIPAGKTAKMTYIVTADRSRWGKNYYYATPVVDGQAYKPLSIWAFTKEDFSQMSASEQENGPQPVFTSSSSGFGKVKKGTKITATFSFTNMGGRPFHIYKADAENRALSLPASFRDTEPGGKDSFSCTLDTSGLPYGENDIAIILTTNSPLRPVISLYVSGTITK